GGATDGRRLAEPAIAMQPQGRVDRLGVVAAEGLAPSIRPVEKRAPRAARRRRGIGAETGYCRRALGEERPDRIEPDEAERRPEVAQAVGELLDRLAHRIGVGAVAVTVG